MYQEVVVLPVYLTFGVAEHTYGIALEDVLEIVPAARLAPLPGAPSGIQGVLNLRGTVLPVMSARQRFGVGDRPLDSSEHFIVLRAGPPPLALRVDCAQDLVDVPRSAIESARNIMRGLLLVSEVARVPAGLLVIANPERFLSEVDAAVLVRALRALEEAPA